MRLRLLVLAPALFALHCASPDMPDAPDALPDSALTAVPAWAEHAVWYQIFVERFRNGDPSNDPTLNDIADGPHFVPKVWSPTPWDHDWYRQEDWAAASGEPFYTTVQARRYGGDLQGVLDRLDDLQDLGVTALYFNPLNDSPSLHKYDARYYHHIDRTFGPDPEGDAALIAREDPADPSTWVFTAADSLFLHLIDEVHRRDMRLIVDYSWNHTGDTFWAFRDVLERGAESPYAAWYMIDQFDDPATPESEFDYRMYNGDVRSMPELRKVDVQGYAPGRAYEGNLHPDVREHIFAVTRRWLDPDGDGDPSDGIDGFRLDVAERVPLGFWRDFRRVVRAVNPEAYLVGEIWWERWPDLLTDPAPFLQGDVFDAVMNYRWYMPTRSFFADALPRETAASYAAHLDSLADGLAPPVVRAMMNLTASHDSPRFATSVYNPGRYKYDVNPRDNAAYRLGPPDARTKDIQRLILVQQFTYPGAPHIWNGDEVGMWGADDPDCRKPLVWPDLTYEPEVADPLGRPRPATPVAPDLELRDFYRRLIAARRAHRDLFVYGDVSFVLTDDARGLLAYTRTWEDRLAVVAFNKSDRPQPIDLEAEGAFRDLLDDGSVQTTDGRLGLTLAPRSAVVLVREEPS